MISAKQAFAANVKTVLILLLLVCFVLITQKVSKPIYQYGLLALVVVTLFQMVFSNIPSSARFKQSMIYLAIGAVILTALVLFAIWLAPTLATLGQ